MDEKTLKTARSLIAVARQLIAADGVAQEFIDNYNYTDANPDFVTADVNRKDGVLTFNVVLTPSVRLDVEIVVAGGLEIAGSVTTRWNIDSYVYSNGGFQPNTQPVKTELKGAIDAVTAQANAAIAKCTNGLKVMKK